MGLSTLLRMLNQAGLLQVFKFFPVVFAPVMDFSVKHNSFIEAQFFSMYPAQINFNAFWRCVAQ